MTSSSGASGSIGGGDSRSHGSVGAYLARQRRLRGISLEQLAQTTRIPQRSLERLEAGAFDTVSDGFVRGFVRTVALALGLDSDEAVSRLLVEPGESVPTRSSRWGASTKGLAFVALAISLGLVIATTLAWVDSPTLEGSETVVRRDPVRALQEASNPPFSSRSSAPKEPMKKSGPVRP